MNKRTTMSKKRDTIRKALNEKGVCITDGIPEHIIVTLHAHGYKIKKRKAKRWTSVSQ